MDLDDLNRRLRGFLNTQIQVPRGLARLNDFTQKNVWARPQQSLRTLPQQAQQIVSNAQQAGRSFASTPVTVPTKTVNSLNAFNRSAFRVPLEAPKAIAETYLYDSQRKKLLPQNIITDRANYEAFLSNPIEFASMTGDIGAMSKVKTPNISGGIDNALSQTKTAAQSRLKSLLTYSDELLRRGYSKAQVDKIGVNEGRRIIAENIPADLHPTFKQVTQRVNSLRNLVQPKKLEEKVAELFPKNIDVKTKVNILDYLRTPDRVLEKMGLGAEAKGIKTAYSRYQTELPLEVNKITEWAKRVPKESNVRIFKYLDGQPMKLEADELQVAKEIRQYLVEWADKLNLPKEARISNYITHIFEKDLIQQEFDPDLAAMIREKVPGSVYDPFLLKRGENPHYVEDTWRALQAYVKRAVRKVNMDPALERLQNVSGSLEESQFNYVKRYADKINMRPSEIDNLLDNAIKSIPFVGYKLGQRPVNLITKTARRAVYRGLLGLNPMSALRNLSQASNTYAELGERWTASGYFGVVKNLKNILSGADTELNEVGVLLDGVVQDKQLGAVKKTLEKADPALFYLFELAEKINRGAAYWGAKARAIHNGKSEALAIEEAKEIVRKTQFTFGSVDTPLALQGDIAKTLGQFQSYSLKQAEFIGEKITKKDLAGLVRYTAATYLWIHTIGKLYGADWKDAIPSVRIGTPPAAQFIKGAFDVVTGAKDKFGNEPDPNYLTRALENYDLRKGLTSYIPAGSAITRGASGVMDVNRGYKQTKSGNVVYPIDRNALKGAQALLFGSKSLSEGQEYYDKKRTPLGESQTALYKQEKSREAYDKIIQQREADANLKLAVEVAQKLNKTIESDGWVLYPEKGEIKKIDTNFEPEKPKLTGQKSLDDDLTSEYKSELTRKQSDIRKLYQLGRMSKEEADKQIKKYEVMKIDKDFEVQPPKKTGNAALDKILLSDFKSDLTKKKNIIIDLFEAGEITAAEAERQLTELENLRDKYSAGKKAPKIPAIKIRKPSSPTLGSSTAMTKVSLKTSLPNQRIKLAPIKIKKIYEGD